MKITDVKAFSLSAPLKEPWQIAKIAMKEMTTTIVEIFTDEGISGIGECLTRLSPLTTCSIVNEIFKPILVGADPLDVAVLWEKMFSTMRSRGHHKGFMIEAISGVDIALWDVMGKALGLPIHKLLGGCYRDRIKVYASSLLFKDTNILVKEAIKLVEEGYPAIKLKIGQGLEKDIQNVKTIRKAIGDGIQLMVDANSAFDSFTAIQLARKLEPYDIFWFEEPVPPDDIDGYAKISKTSPIPVAAGESEFTKFGFRDLITKGGVAIIQPDVSRAGGISECKKITDMASAYNLPYSPHTGASGAINIAASLQLAAGISNFLIFEYMYPPNPLRENILQEPLPKPKNGYIPISNEPGLGIKLNRKVVSKYLKC